MSFRMILGFLGGVTGSLLVASSASAQCSMDTDCKGDRVCEAGACVAPALPPAPAAPSGATPAAAAPAPAPAPPPPVYSVPPGMVQDTRPKMQRHSTGMMAGGIVMVSFVPVALLASLVANAQQSSCEAGYYFYNGNGSTSTTGSNCDRYDATIYGGLISAAVLAGVGIPMIVIGGKKEPVATAQLAPWATRNGGGLGLRFDL